MAPEILGLSNSARKDSKYTSAVDMWSLGCLLHYALTKESPFPKYQTLYDHFRGLSPYPEESLVCKGIGISARQFIKKLLVLEPADRPPASIDLMSGWIISETAYKSPFGTNSERKVSAGSDDDLDILSTEGWRNHVAGSPSPFASISRSAPTNNDASDAESMVKESLCYLKDEESSNTCHYRTTIPLNCGIFCETPISGQRESVHSSSRVQILTSYTKA